MHESPAPKKPSRGPVRFDRSFLSPSQEKMTPLQRTLAVALVTAEVHNRDVLEVLVNKEVIDPQNFLWQAQLR